MAAAVGSRAAPLTSEGDTSPKSEPPRTSDIDLRMTHPKTESTDVPPALVPPLPSLQEETQRKLSVQHSLAPDTSITSQGRSRSKAASSKSPHRQDTPSKPLLWVEGPADGVEPDLSTQNDSYTRAAEFNPSHTMTVAHTRRNANGTIGSVYSGNKIRHLKKDDGVPLWRKDIQLKFLRCVFEDETAVFTRAFDGSKGHTFADIYVDAMARSSKTSKVLKEKLLADKEGAMTMAMICLLVNVGRMNTTLNFFPEMRAQLRTYHAIPSLQAHADPSAYKQLQDAPRLKSILKGASEDASQPSTIDKIKQAEIPRTNPVNLIFVLSQYAPIISETHFHPPREFFDLVVRATLSSKSRAKAFLWLIWWYLESNFSEQDALNNPFGPGQHGDEAGGMPIKVPAFEHLTEEQADAENVDTENELAWGEMKREERKRILEDDETVGPPMKRSRKINGESHIPISDTDPIRSPSPSPAIQTRASLSVPRGEAAANGFGPESSPTAAAAAATAATLPPPRATTPRYPPLQSKASPHRLALKTSLNSTTNTHPASSSPADPSSRHPNLSATTSTSAYRRQRPETSHQKAVSRNRRMRTDHILHKQMLSAQKRARKEKRRTTSSVGMLAYERILGVPDTYETDDERGWGPAGLMPNPGREGEDYGEEAIRHRKVVERALRRLERAEGRGNSNGWGGGGMKVNGGASSSGGVGEGGGTTSSYPWFSRKRKRKQREVEDANENENEEAEQQQRVRGGKRRKGGDAGRTEKNDGSNAARPKQEGLDDLDLDLLGEGRSDEDGRSQDESDGSEGDGDETDDEA